jgi:hypothetical protein
VSSVGGVQTAQGSRGELAAIAGRRLPGWRVLIAAALLSSALAAALLAGLAGVRVQGSASERSAPSASRASAHKGLASLPLTAQGSVSQALGADDPAYGVHASSTSSGRFSAASPAQRLSLGFDRSGVSVGSGAEHVGMSLRAIGYGGSLETVGAVTPRASANRVVYGLPDLEQWYANGPLGLEQGFTIPRAVTAHPGGALTLAIALSGNALATLAAGGQSVTLARAGAPALRYTGLAVTDARGRALHAWLGLHGRTLLLHVDLQGARYPLRIDPLIQQAMLTGSGEVGAGTFGYSVALSAEGNTALIGGPADNEGAGAAWVFTREGTSWTQQGAKLTGSEEIGAGRFGYSVALSSQGNTALIGGPYDNTEAGAAWVFTRTESSWTQQGAKLIGSEETGTGLFGFDVALSSEANTALIGGAHDNSGVGAAWVFTRTESSWTQQGAKLTGNEETGDAWFGYSVALSSNGNTALIGGIFDNRDAGAAWVFTRAESTWTQQGAKLTGKEEVGAGWFGSSVALSSNGNTALVGGVFSANVGAAWVFAREGTTWTGRGTPVTGKAEVGEGHFGASVALSSNGATELVGGPDDNREAGAVWVFVPTAPSAVTLPAASLRASTATLNATVNPNGAEISSCEFEYGEAETYGSSMPCSPLPGSQESPVGVSAAVSGLNAYTTYHYRIVATNAGGTSNGEDHTFTTLGYPPDFGRCVKLKPEKVGPKSVYHGGFTSKSCTVASETNSGKYEWHPGIVNAGFTSTLKKDTVVLETVDQQRVTCTTESTAGEYSGLQDVKGVVIKLGGCEMLGHQCTTPGLEEGKLETKPLEGKIGWEAKATGAVGLALYPVGDTGLFMEYRCVGTGLVTVEGSVIAPVKTDAMDKTAAMAYAQKRGIQEPEDFEGEPVDTLTALLNGEASERLGVQFTAELRNQEASEVNTEF